MSVLSTTYKQWTSLHPGEGVLMCSLTEERVALRPFPISWLYHVDMAAPSPPFFGRLADVFSAGTEQYRSPIFDDSINLGSAASLHLNPALLDPPHLDQSNVFFFCCIAELAIKPCRSSRSKLRGEFGIPNTCKTGNKNTTKQQTPPNPKHNTTQNKKPASVWNVKREVSHCFTIRSHCNFFRNATFPPGRIKQQRKTKQTATQQNQQRNTNQTQTENQTPEWKLSSLFLYNIQLK